MEKLLPLIMDESTKIPAQALEGKNDPSLTGYEILALQACNSLYGATVDGIKILDRTLETLDLFDQYLSYKLEECLNYKPKNYPALIMDESTQKLVQALEGKNDPKLAQMIDRAKKGYYHEYKSALAMPIMTLVADLRGLGCEDLAQQAINGDFDATREESDRWAKTPEAQALFAEIGGTKRKGRDKPNGFGKR